MPSFEEATNTERAPFKVLVIGGSYAGLGATLNLLDLCHGRKCRFSCDPADDGPAQTVPVQITIVDERDGFYHLIGVPMALASNKYADKFWTKFADIPALQTPEVKMVQGRVESVDCESKVARIKTGTGIQKIVEQQYDYLVAGSGLKREWPSAPRSLTRENYLVEAAESVKKIEDSSEGVVVIGGGAVGIEIAAEIKMLQPQTKVTLIHSRNQLLSSEALPDEFSERTLQVLQSDVDVILGSRVLETTPSSTNSTYTLTLSDGRQLTASHVINAVSRFSPTSSYLPEGAYNEDGYVLIKPTLQIAGDIPNAEYHYAAGDIAQWSGIKRGGAAMHQGHYAARNIHQRMFAKLYNTTPKFAEIAEVSRGMALGMGEMGVAYWPSDGVTSGKDVREMFFRDDLGFMICWSWMRLGEPTA